jgi:hypothetical protein
LLSINGVRGFAKVKIPFLKKMKRKSEGLKIEATLKERSREISSVDQLEEVLLNRPLMLKKKFHRLVKISMRRIILRIMRSIQTI